MKQGRAREEYTERRNKRKVNERQGKGRKDRRREK